MASTMHGPAAPDQALEGSGRLDRATWVLGGVLMLGSVMAVLDTTVVNVAIPTLAAEFASSVSAISWVITAYLLAFATVIPLTGWASQRFGAKRVWLASLTAFVAGSFLAGVSTSIAELIVFRVAQGVAAGMIMPLAQTILAQAVGPQRVGRVMSIIAVPMLLAPVLGPVLGGAIIEQASWRWIFFVNLPVGAVAILSAWRLLPASRARPGQRLDVLGVLLLTPGIALLIYGLSLVSASGSADLGSVLQAAAGLALIAAFLWHARGRAGALIDLSLFRQPGFATASAASLLIGIALFGTLLLIPLYFQVVRGETALGTGLLLAPQGLGAALAMPFAGRATDRIGAHRVVPVGVLLAVLGIAAYTQVTPDSSSPLLAGALFVIGLGLGSTFLPAMAVAYRSVAREQMPAASSALNTIQRIAGSIGTALLAVVLQRAIGAEVPSLAGGLDGIGRLPAAALARVLPLLAHAFDTAFWVALVLTAAALVPALLLGPWRRPRAGRA
ncbi:MAG TPA: DHA2 family efflux MFS transporter permease subunit [Actinomycetes bacterium]